MAAGDQFTATKEGHHREHSAAEPLRLWLRRAVFSVLLTRKIVARRKDFLDLQVCKNVHERAKSAMNKGRLLVTAH
jgi:hypothetical protein